MYSIGQLKKIVQSLVLNVLNCFHKALLKIRTRFRTSPVGITDSYMLSKLVIVICLFS